MPADSSETADVHVPTIESIEVEQLFGRFDYVLSAEEALAPGNERLLILYGDNGAGKTTVLRLAFHLLSTAPNRGHKTALVAEPFRRFGIKFTNGLRVEAIRSKERLTGPFSLQVVDNAQNVTNFDFVVNEGRIKVSDNPDLEILARKVAGILPFDVYYLTDDRELHTDKLPSKRARAERQAHRSHGRGRVGADNMQPVDLLDDLVDQATHWLRRQALQGSAVGNLGANAVYTDVLRRLATPSPHDDPSMLSPEDSLSRLTELAERNEEYARYGLASRLDGTTMISALNEVVGTPQEPAFLRVLTTFMDGLRTQLDALAGVYTAMAKFEGVINSFYEGKKLEISLTDGITIHTEGDETRLQSSQLSSGERQLLSLFINTVFAQETPSIFLVDEPELSLNMKWQRRLVESLLDATHGTNTQFILASHSFEILTGVQDRTIEMRPNRARSHHVDIEDESPTDEF